MSDKDSRRSTSGYVLTLGGGAISWRSIKQKCIADSTTEAEYVEPVKQLRKLAVWLKKFLMELGVVPAAQAPITLYYDNSGAVTQSNEPRNHGRGKHVERKYHLIREIVQRGDVLVTKITTAGNLADPFMKALSTKVFDRHMDSIGIRCNPNWL